ncbi:MAG TPA: family 78 glycoside hydrolase catalytic domain [Tepidisphaeraceae bacterium]|nr:family 78 glycoside hydrolase catalytic domain [Tepidisphaeraceae bacterium]
MVSRIAGIVAVIILALVHGNAARAAAGGSVTPVALRCDARENPLGIDSPAPKLSWILRANAAAARGLTQSAYQIVVASSPELLAKDQGDLWDSGKTADAVANQVAYAGKPLRTDQVAWWKVRAWDGAGEPSDWSEPALWGMGVLEPADWGAKWIAAPDHLAGAASSTALLRGEFPVKANLKRATLNICGLGQYDATINGRPVTADLLAPGWTEYTKTCLYDTHDVTPLLRQGPNAVGVLLGNGMYRVKKERYAKFEKTFGPLQLIARIRLEYANGSSEVIGTGDTWRAGPSPMTFSGVYGGEDWDARIEQRDWNQPGFRAADQWEPVRVTQGPGGALRGASRSAPPVRAFQVHKPVAQKQLKPNVTVYDLGQTASQMPQVVARGPAGSIVKITPTELLNPDGSIFRNNYNGKPWCQFTLAGTGGDEAWTSRFFYAGLRYLQVECIPAPGGGEAPRVESIEGIVVHNAVAHTGEFACSNELFNRIAAMVKWAELGNMMSVISDCPHRERLGWLEQSHLHGPAFWYAYDMRPLFTKIIGDMADCQEPGGLIPTCVPDYPKFPPKWRDAIEWGSAGVMIPWQKYVWTGDLDVLRQNYPMMKRYVEHLTSRAKDHIAAPGLGDWSGRGPSPETPKDLIATALYFDNAATLARAAKLLGQDGEAKAHEELAASIRAAFNRKFYDASARRYGTGSQAANAFALCMGLVEPTNRDAVLASLIADIESRKHAMTVGEVGLPYLLRALADAGRSDVNFAMHNQSEHPGYGYQLKMGATALCETWDAYRDNSQIQFMLGHITEWFYGDVAGIRPDPDRPGFRHVIIRPSVVGDLTEARGSYRSVRGRIVSEWRREGQHLSLHVVIPPGATATVHVPAARAEDITEGGKPAGEAAGVKLVRADGKAATYEVGSGDYTFRSSLP